ncbi:MAG: hypothetical protein N2747_07505 [Chitinophagaceae bacterium]|nr:hypothetical protein [Chitinophagaceae bacterium]
MKPETIHKILEAEINPPESAWKNISAGLDEMAGYHAISQSLYNLSITPPDRVWEKISIQIPFAVEEENIQQKLNAFEPTPPAFSPVLTGNISHEPEKSVRQFFLFRRLAVAAAIIGLLIWGGIRLWNSSENPIPENTAQNNPIPKPTFPETKPKASDSDNTQLEKITNESATKDNSLSDERDQKPADAHLAIHKLKTKPEAYDNNPVTVNTRGLDLTEENVIKESNYKTEPGQPLNISERYVIMLTPEGKIIRLSKKLGPVMLCLAGEIQDDKCKTQLENWRRQMLEAGPSHPGNFVDILNLVETFSEQ